MPGSLRANTQQHKINFEYQIKQTEKHWCYFIDTLLFGVTGEATTNFVAAKGINIKQGPVSI